MNSDAGALPEDLARFVDGERWTYAKTMPTWPHEYLVRERVDPGLFECMVRHIRSYGHEGRFYQRRITYYEKDGLMYWTMGAPVSDTTIINRCRKEDSFECRSTRGNLPDRRLGSP